MVNKKVNVIRLLSFCLIGDPYGIRTRECLRERQMS